MTELENSFVLFCDDPEVFSSISDRCERDRMISEMRQRIENAAVMWNLAEAFFQLSSYFRFKLAVSKDIIASSGLPRPKMPKGGRGIGALYKHVTALETSNVPNSSVSSNLVRSYTSPHLEVHTGGYWRRIESSASGIDREGKPTSGRTWVQSTDEWRARPHEQRTVYIKSSVAAAKLRVSEYLEAAQRVDNGKPSSGETTGVLYVMRCVAMKDEVYKVGFTTKTAELRAQELSSATGVPTAFVVVESWQHGDPEGLEKGVHAMLDPYRINETREFFKLQYPELKSIIESEIERTHRHLTCGT
jgi:hypothetical protein